MEKNKQKVILEIIGLSIAMLILIIPILCLAYIAGTLFSYPKSELHRIYQQAPETLKYIFIGCSTPILFFKLWKSKTRLNFIFQIFARALLAVSYAIFMYITLHVELLILTLILSITY